MSSVHGLHSSRIVLEGVDRQGWWLIVPGEAGPHRVVAGPFPGRAEAQWAAQAQSPAPDDIVPAFGVRRADGGLTRRPSPQDWAWLSHLTGHLERLPEDWDADMADDDPLVTLVVEVTAALVEAGLPVHDADGEDSAAGGVCLTPEPVLDGIVVSWRQHDRMSVDRVHGEEPDALVQHVMNGALADILLVRGFDVEPLGQTGGHVVRAAA